MATLRTGSVVADIRGKVGNEVYSRNHYGAFVRSVAEWIQPNTQRQLDARDVMIFVGPAWSSTLTEQQRNDWRSYAQQHPRPNRWGEYIQTSGYNNFVRTNSYRYRDAQAIDFPDAPTSPPLHPPTFTFTADVLADTITITLPPANYDPPWAQLRLFLFAGKPVSQGRNFFNAPWRYAASNLFNATWTTDPWTLASPWPIDAGKRMWCYLVAQHATEGQLSNPARAQHDTT